MNNELVKSLEAETSEKLFYYFKHDGSIDFEKKIIAGKILNDKCFDKAKLLHEKEIIVDSILNELKISESSDYLRKKSRKEINKNIYFWLGFILIFLTLEVKDYWTDKENFELTSLLIIILTGLIFFTYTALNYKKTLSKLINSGINNNELLRLRLSLIETEWDF
jgi:type IV secretory pathway TrbL component